MKPYVAVLIVFVLIVSYFLYRGFIKAISIPLNSSEQGSLIKDDNYFLIEDQKQRTKTLKQQQEDLMQRQKDMADTNRRRQEDLMQRQRDRLRDMRNR